MRFSTGNQGATARKPTWRYGVERTWLKVTLTAVKVGVGTALLFAVLLGYLEKFDFDVTNRSLTVGAIAALITFLSLTITSLVNRYRY